MDKKMLPTHVTIGLAAIEKLGITDARGKMFVMRFSKIYSPAKITAIVAEAQTYSWWKRNPGMAFMKAVGVVNAEGRQLNSERNNS